MDIVIAVVTITLVIVLLAWLVMQPQKKVLRVSVPFFVAGFVLIYAIYLVALLRPDEPQLSAAIAFKAFVASYQSVASGADYALLSQSDVLAPIAGSAWFITGFWFLHLLLFAMLTLSGFAVFGRRLMDAGRLALARLTGKRDVYHIFGDGESALRLGRNIAAECPQAMVVCYSGEYQEGLREKIADFGGALIEATERSRGTYLGKAQERWPGNVAVFSGVREDVVNGVDVADLLARKAVRDHAPYKSACPRPGQQGEDAADSCGCFPQGPYAAVIVGFGQLGRSCAKWLIESAQLNPDGTRPRIFVADPDALPFERFMIENPAISRCADIRFLNIDGFSTAFRDFLEAEHAERGAVPKIFVCVSEVGAMNHRELEVNRSKDCLMERHIALMLRHMGLSAAGVICAPNVENADIWTREIILHQRLDDVAVRMNGMYGVPEGDSMAPAERERRYREAWESTREFHRDSSRASCDFMPAMLALAGVDPGSADAGARFRAALAADAQLIECLARVEHLRWCAFHYVNGYVPMARADFARRVDALLEARAQVEQGHAGAVPEALRKPQQDFAAKEHACLVPWDELPALDEIYRRYDEKMAADADDTLQRRDQDNVEFLERLL
ncbi:MAG: hypothetical protein HFJ75_00150 [Eggerthellaceae bacterium]|nr:hypothetical protein [Eggerthellaceae bacterium]